MGDSSRAPLDDLQLDHIGIVVDNIEDAERVAVEILGMALLRRVEVPERLRAAFYAAGAVAIEFIEPLGEERAPRLGSLQAKIEHVAFRTTDVLAACERLRESGVGFTSSEPRLVSGSRSYFTLPVSTDGVVYQVFDRPGDAEPLAANSYQVVAFADASWADRGNGVRTAQLVRRLEGARTFLNGITEFNPGAALPFHFHNCDESVMILEGSAQVEVGQDSRSLSPFDTAFIRAGQHHRFVNSGDAKLRIHWTYGSVDATRTIVAIGLAVDVVAESAPTGADDR